MVVIAFLRRSEGRYHYAVSSQIYESNEVNPESVS